AAEKRSPTAAPARAAAPAAPARSRPRRESRGWVLTVVPFQDGRRPAQVAIEAPRMEHEHAGRAAGGFQPAGTFVCIDCSGLDGVAAAPATWPSVVRDGATGLPDVIARATRPH